MKVPLLKKRNLIFMLTFVNISTFRVISGLNCGECDFECTVLYEYMCM